MNYAKNFMYIMPLFSCNDSEVWHDHDPIFTKEDTKVKKTYPQWWTVVDPSSDYKAPATVHPTKLPLNSKISKLKQHAPT